MTLNLEKYAPATVVDRRDLGDDLWIIRVRPECELPFRPGQYVTVGLEVNGRIIERPYSIASAPDEDAVELFIERVPGGELSAPLHGLGVGGAMVVRRRCKGLFLKDAPVDGPHLFVATVTGIAPFVSFIRALKVKHEAGGWSAEHGVTVLQGAARSEEFGYAEELDKLAAECSWLSYVPTVSRPHEDPAWQGETGRVDDILRKYADQAGIAPGHGGVFLCGHPGMIGHAREILRRRGIDDKSIREEQYWPD